MTDSYNQNDINLSGAFFEKQRVIEGADAASDVLISDSHALVTVDTTVVHTVTLPPASEFPRGFSVYYLTPNAGAVANVNFDRTAPDTINRKAANFILAADDDWVLLVSDGVSNWSALIGA